LGRGIPRPKYFLQEVDLRFLSNRTVILSVIILLLISISNTYFPVSGDITTQTFWETDLNSDGYAYEINSGLNGTLWISDNSAGEIRVYQPSSNLMTIYSDLGVVSDARPDGEGNVWFIDQVDDQLGKLYPSDGGIQYWDLGSDITPFGTAFDPQGKILVSLRNSPILLRFDPGDTDEGSLCSLDLSATDFNGSYYLVDHSGTIWLGGTGLIHRLVKVNEKQYQLTQFEPQGSLTFSVEGLLADGMGGLWFTDSQNKSILHLNPEAAGGVVFSRYPVPAGTPYMLTSQNDLIWFTGQIGVVGSLNPSALTPENHTIDINETIVEPSCVPLTAFTGNATVSTETPVWVEAVYPLESITGWNIVDLGEDSYPWGITISDGSLWAIDQGKDHKVLMRTVVEASITACKFSDADGELATIDDRTPLAGWGMTLYQEESPISTQQTAENGCTTWNNLPLGVTYTVEEEQRNGWAVLEPANGICDLEQISQVGQYSCVFINWKKESNIFLPLVIK
jgi:streptogramin lyase